MSNLSAGVPRQLVTFLHEKYFLEEFIETGTFRGESTAFAASMFKYVLTIEIDEENWHFAKNRVGGVNEHDAEVDFWRGDSAELMASAMRQLDGRALIWLDAHNVAGQFGNEDSCPVLEELIAVNGSGEHHFILIDDAHCFHPPLPMHLTPDAWPTIEDIQHLAALGGYAVLVAHDMIILATYSEMTEIKQFLDSLPGPRNAMMRRISCSAEAVNGPMRIGAVPAAFPAFTGLTYTNYGWMLVHRFDPAQTPALTLAGVSRDHQDIEMLGEHLLAAGFGAVFVDIGANVGCYSFGVRRFCSAVHAFEPQRIIYNMLAGSVALNGWTNVYTHNVALGRSNGSIEIPQFNYNKALSFGSVEFGTEEQKEPLLQQRGHDASRREFVAMRQLDDYGLHRVDVMKIDVEGMELAVLSGATETINRCRPVILIEHGKSDRAVLQTVMEAKGYVVKEHGTFDFLCIPK